LTLIAATLAFITVTLAVRDLRPDLSALAAAGTDRRIRSRLTAAHAGMVVALGLLAGLTVTAVSVPALLVSLDVGWSLWPVAGLSAAALGALMAALLAGRVGGARVTTLLRRAD
jgi:hypothetical protein